MSQRFIESQPPNGQAKLVFEKGCKKCEPITVTADPLDFNGLDDPKVCLHRLPVAILMNRLYGARFARWDLLKAGTKLATLVTSWTTACDAALLRLVRHLKATVDWVLVGYMG